MKSHLKHLIVCMTAVVTATVGLAPLTLAAAPQLVLVSGLETLRPGQSVNVALKVTGSDTTAVKATVGFDTEAFSFVQAIEDNSAFSSVAVTSSVPGELSIDAKNGSGTGDRQVVLLRYTAKKPGETDIRFTGTNQIATKSCLLFLCNTKFKDVETGPAAQFSITRSETKTPSPIRQPQPSSDTHVPDKPRKAASSEVTQPTPSSKKQDSSKRQPVTVPDAAEDGKRAASSDFAITDFTVSNITTTSAVIEWQTSEPATAHVSYGVDSTHYTDTITIKERATLHQLELAKLATDRHYTVRLDAAAANKAKANATLEFSTSPLVTTGPIKKTTSPPANHEVANEEWMIAGILTSAALAVGLITVIRLLVISRQGRLLEASILATYRLPLRRYQSAMK